MKFLSDVLHKIPWWFLLGGGVLLFVALGVYVTPFHLISLEKKGTSAQEKQQIKREIDTAFSEGAIDVARSILKEMAAHTRDPDRKEELQKALEEVESAREGLREAGVEVLRAKREAAQNVTEAVQEATRAIETAQRDAAKALKDAGVEDEKVKKALEQSMKAAREAETEAKRATTRSRERKERIIIGSGEEGGPQIRLPDGTTILGRKPPVAPSVPETTPTIPAMPAMPAMPDIAIPAIPPLPPEVRQDIRQKVTGDLYRIGVGAGLILLFIPLFILAVVAKVFIDRSRAAQRMAELKRKEAEYHRMGQQVTEAKLQALQAQVEPHFLYNTLASVQALTEVDPQQANAMTGHLIQYLRNALPKMRDSVSTVGQEIELVRAYLNILQMRMGKRLAFEINVPPELLEASFPPLMLPSLVENAIKHGLEPQREGGSITITAGTLEGKLRVRVADTGRGFAETLGAGVGLANIRERLAGLYGENAKLTLEANEPHGVVAMIEVPREGGRATGASASAPSAAPPAQQQPTTVSAKVLSAMGTAERAWRKGLSFAFVCLVVIAAVLAGLGIVGVSTGILPVHVGGESVGGMSAALIGTAGIVIGFAAVVLALAIVVAVLYGLGFLMVGILIFVVIMIVVSLVPPLAPFILIGLFIWWLVRRSKRKSEAAAAANAAPPTPDPQKEPPATQ